jgi:prolipoprotein diacylglyceryltransferase
MAAGFRFHDFPYSIDKQLYPNLYYIFKAWFGVEWHPLMYLNTFGLMVALGFLVAALVMVAEMKRKEKMGLLMPREEIVLVGKPAGTGELIINALSGFLFGYKLLGLFFSKPEDVSPQSYIFSSAGSWAGGLILAVALTLLKWYERKKQQLAQPEKRTIRIWPHDRAGDIVIVALIAGIVGAKLFDNLENWSDFIQNPVERLFSAGGLTFYGGLIVATLSVCWYAFKKNIGIIHLADCIAPAMMIAYAVGRIGCQVSGDGDWGIYNSAYITAPDGKMAAAAPGTFEKQLQQHSAYFLRGEAPGATPGSMVYVTDRRHEKLSDVPHKAVSAPSWLPDWLFAYNYPQNVNKDGVLIPGNTEEHNRVLPSPVFPTPLYETILCTLLFLVLWLLRKSFTTAGMVSALYLILNGIERFLIEKIRVNNTSDFLGMQLSQAEIISAGLMLAGLAWMLLLLRRKRSLSA